VSTGVCTELSHQHRVTLLAKLRVLLLDLACLLVEDTQKLEKRALLYDRVNVQYASVTRANDGLVLKNLDCGIEPPAGKRACHTLQIDAKKNT
jgi:hypothetical protein